MGYKNLSRRQLIVLTVAAVLADEAKADLYDDYINSTSKQPFVAFLARNGVPGHAFVGIGVKLEAGVSVYERFFGFYPLAGGTASEVKLVFGKVSGALDYKWKDTAWDEAYVVRVDDAQKTAPRRFVWNPTVRIAGHRRARWACGQAAFEPVHMSTGQLPGARN